MKDVGGDRRRGSRGFFTWLPWEKLTIWALFLFLVYTLRDFFSVLFLTFIFSYVMTTIVRKIMGIVSPRKERQWLHRTLVVVTFVLLLGSLYGLVAFLKEPFRRQIDSMRIQVKQLELRPQTIWEDLARNTVGKWRFEAMYRDDREAFARDVQEFRETRYQTTALENFRIRQNELESVFRKLVVDERGESAYDALVAENRHNVALLDWVEKHRSRAIYEQDIQTWNAEYGDWYGGENGTKQRFSPDTPSLEEHREEEGFGAAQQSWILARIAKDEVNTKRDDLQKKFREHLGNSAYADLVSSGKLENEFEKFYLLLTNQELEARDKTPGGEGRDYAYARYVELGVALAAGEEEFHRVLIGDKDPTIAVEQSFKRERQTVLARETLEEWEFLQLDKLRTKIQESVPEVIPRVYDLLAYLFQFVVYFALSLLLSFFITFDLPRIKQGVQRLAQSQIRDFYHEIAPGLAAFGSLIGRAFQAQGVIAICNALLTLGLIRLLGIPFEIFLCTIVFFCSFIPVVGVVLSTVPIALIALLHNDVYVALWSVGGVLLIHFIETSILNPKIFGEMLHLHPVLVLGILVLGEHFFGVWGLLLGVPVMVYIIRHVILQESLVSVVAVSSPSTGTRRRGKDDGARALVESGAARGD